MDSQDRNSITSQMEGMSSNPYGFEWKWSIISVYVFGVYITFLAYPLYDSLSE
jgi:hypothetical protein